MNLFKKVLFSTLILVVLIVIFKSQVINAAAPTVTITANPGTIGYNSHSFLTWTSTGSNSCTLTRLDTGEITVVPTNMISPGKDTGPLTSTTTFTIDCTNALKVTTGYPLNAKGNMVSNCAQPIVVYTDDQYATGIAPGLLLWLDKNLTIPFSDGSITQSGGSQKTYGVVNGGYPNTRTVSTSILVTC